MIVTATLQHWRSVPFQWGKEDCLLSIGDYLIKACGVDWGDIFRGTYDTEAGALAHVKAWGGADRILDRTGLARTASPGRGDVVIAAFNEPTAGLCTGDAVAFRLKRGVVEVNRKFISILHAWEVPSCRP